MVLVDDEFHELSCLALTDLLAAYTGVAMYDESEFNRKKARGFADRMERVLSQAGCGFIIDMGRARAVAIHEATTKLQRS